jgi:hypothetical protein
VINTLSPTITQHPLLFWGEGEERRRGIREDWENRVRREMM